MTFGMRPAGPGGWFASAFCSARHPNREDVSCRRFKGHPGDHKAFAWGIITPESWPNDRSGDG